MLIRFIAVVWLLSLLSPAQQVVCQPGSAAPGVICLSGHDLGDHTAGPLQAGTVYHVVGPSTIPAGRTLTAQPGAVVKFLAGTQITVQGTLNVPGPAATFFTSIADDSVGGDSNLDGGQTIPARGDWPGLFFLSSSGNINGAEIRYARRGIRLQSSDITITNTTIRETQVTALTLNNGSEPTVSGCDFTDGDGIAVIEAPITAIPGFTNNTASNNDGGDFIRVEFGSIGPSTSTSVTIGPGNTLNSTGVLVTGAPFDIELNSTLTLQNGMIVKWSDCCGQSLEAIVNGTLDADGVVWTSFKDDNHGGDTNGDGGATSPAPGDWVRIKTISGGTVNLANCLLRFGGGSTAPACVDALNGTLQSTTIESSAAGGVRGVSETSSIDDCAFIDSAGIAIDDVHLAAVSNLTNNTAAANAGGDYVRVGAGLLLSNATWDKVNTLNDDGVLVFANTPSVEADLTIEAGMILKFEDGKGFSVFGGTLICNGDPIERIVLTSIHDDFHGGDTNLNGATTIPTPGVWNGFHHVGGGASVVDQVLIRYGTFANQAAVKLDGANNLTLSNVTVELSDEAGIRLSGGAPTLTNCAFNNCRKAGEGIPLDALPNFSGITATGNAEGDYLELTGVSLIAGAPLTINPSQGPGNGQEGVTTTVFVIGGTLSIGLGASLTVEEGVIFKCLPGFNVNVSGTLTCSSENGGPVAWTSLADDTIGGDTTKDGGATTPQPGDWTGIQFNAGADASQLNHTTVAYAGSQVAALRLTLADITLRDCHILDSLTDGLDLGAASFPTVVDCDFQRCAVAVDRAAIGAIEGFLNCTASLNGGDFQRVTAGILGQNRLLQSTNLLNGGPLVIDADVTIPSGLTLGLDPIIIKWDDGHGMFVFGTLSVLSTPPAGVIFTSIHDDQIAGDTNNNGAATTAAPGDWVGLDFAGTSDASIVQGALLRFAGDAGAAGIDCVFADIKILDTTVELCANDAVDLGGNSAPEIRRSTFRDCGGRATDRAPIRAVASWLDNQSSNCQLDAIRVTSGTLSGQVDVFARNAHNGDGVFVVDASVTAQAAGHLTLHQGVTFKFDGNNRSLLSLGRLDLLGTGLEPVVLTVVEDDAFGGDTNKDGAATSPAPGAWLGVDYFFTSPAALAEHVRVRFAGGGASLAGFNNQSPALTARSIRVDHSASRGIRLTQLADTATNMVAFQCATIGLATPGGTFDVVHATVTGCGAQGIVSAGSHVGNVVNSVSFGNAGANFSGYATFEIIACNGDPATAGANGNINVDPQFVDVVLEDLRLQATSPCVDAADPVFLSTLAKDHDERSRVLDHDLDGGLAPDMGAFEAAAYEMTFGGEPRMGTVMSFTTDGSVAGDALYAIGLLDGETFVAPYGFATLGSLSSIVFIGSFPTGQPIFVPTPVGPFADISFGVQSVTFPIAFGITRGNVTNLYRGTLFE